MATLSIAAFGQAANPPVKIGIISISGAIAATKDGQKADSELQSKFTPKKKSSMLAKMKLSSFKTN